MKAYINYRAGLFIGLLTFTTLFSCIGTRQAMDSEKHESGSAPSYETHPASSATMDKRPSTSLGKNILKGDMESVQLLIDEGVDINKAGGGRTTFGLALECKNQEMAKLLLDKSIIINKMLDVTTKDPETGKAPLHLLVELDYLGLMKRVINQLDVNDLNVVDNDGNTALHMASKEGNLAAVNDLLEMNGSRIEVDTQNKDGNTALHLAIANGHKDIGECLVKAGADFNIKNKHGKTSLSLAIDREQEFIEVIKCVLRKLNIELNSASLRKEAKEGNLDSIALLIASFRADGTLDVINQKGADGNTALHWAAASDHKDVVERLVQVPGINLNAESNDKRTPLHLAAHYGLLSVVEVFLGLLKDKDKDFGVNAQDGSGNTALHLAIYASHVELASRLIEAGIDVNIKNNNGETPLMLARGQNFGGIVKALLATDTIDVHATDEHGNTVLHTAVSLNLVNVVRSLLKRPSIRLDTKNNSNYTPLELANKMHYTEISELLKAAQRQY